MTIRALTLDDLEPYLVHLAAHGAESGRDGDVYFGPYGREHPLPVDEVRERVDARLEGLGGRGSSRAAQSESFQRQYGFPAF